MEITAANIIEIGRHLQAVRDTLNRTLFFRWVWGEFDFSPGTAEYWMRVARKFGDLPIATTKKFQPTAMALLCKGEVPPQALQEAMDRAEAGESITTGKVSDLLHKYAPPESHKVNRNDRIRLSSYLRRMTSHKDEAELPKVADELERQAGLLRKRANGNGHAASSRNGSTPAAEAMPMTDATECKSYSLHFTCRELSDRDLRALRTALENDLREQLADPGCRVDCVAALP
jgi:hypothetical protein